ncbi:MAG: prepilin-type N-terminal cleavage/methylation domain-containing protein [Phycisphaerae bacterium]|nr:prepilin-type N-terminal cleavage/methylation domain-containing protein [Phycisphaerae bacterium]
MRMSKAFTLIELLVVIAIVAILLSVLIPALNVAKAVASGAVCMSNLSALNKTWYLYQEDNDTWLVGLSNYTGTPYRWVEYPLYRDGTVVPDAASCTLEYQLNGLRAGKLYPYTGSEKIYHCVNDKYWKTKPYGPWISYAGSGCMNSEDYTSRSGMNITGFRTVGNVPSGSGTVARQLVCVNKFNQIKSPANRFTFVEEDYVIHNQWRYAGGFVTMNSSDYWSWWDWPAWYHNGRSTLGFADGHAEKHDWRDKRTQELMRKGSSTDHNVQQDNEDLVYVNNGYVPAGW